MVAAHEILLVESHPRTTEMVRQLLLNLPLIRVRIRTAGNLNAAIEMSNETSPDVVLLDMDLDDSGGLATLRDFSENRPDDPIVVISSDEDENQALAALLFGAQEYLVVDDLSTHRLMRAIVCAKQRKKVESDLITAKIRSEKNRHELSVANEKMAAEVAKKEQVEQKLLRSIELLSLSNADLEGKNRDLERLNEELARHEQELQDMNQKLEALSITDPLTGLFNRRHGQKVLTSEMSRMERENRSIGVIMVDVDQFKSINDTYGHAAGDTALLAVSSVFQRTVRPYDTVVRWGGEELLVICPRASSELTCNIAERLRHNLSREEILLGHPPGQLQITASFGVAAADKLVGFAADDLLRACDRAMYRAKRDGRNCVRATLNPSQQ